MTITKAIRNRINEIGAGEPFTSTAFGTLGSRAAIDQTLSRLVEKGELVRLARGVFVQPEKSQYVGEVMPEPLKVAQAIARAQGETIQVHGAEAASSAGSHDTHRRFLASRVASTDEPYVRISSAIL